jgi:hypothetical protein
MAIKREWTPNAPSGSVGSGQRAQLAIGYSGIAIINPNPPPPPIIPIDVNYFRRYLNDVASINSIGPAIPIPAGSETSDTVYFRRYLNDVLAG